MYKKFEENSDNFIRVNQASPNPRVYQVYEKLTKLLVSVCSCNACAVEIFKQSLVSQQMSLSVMQSI